MQLDINHFWRFCSQLIIPTKDFGEVRFNKPLGTQKYFVTKVFEALSQGIHTIVCLKGRQEGISTVMLALDLYWMFKFSGITGTIVSQDEPTRDDFRTKLEQYYESLPRNWRRGKKAHNRYQFLFDNKSGFAYQIAGSRTGNKLGRGKGITFCHATELGSWGNNAEGLASLKASFAEVHPHRLFIYESTANGYDMFHGLWESAKEAVTQRAIFVPWWMKESYSVAEDSPIYRTYFGRPCTQEGIIKRLTAEEIEWFKTVDRLYQYKMTAGQMAWWRWKLTEEFNEDEDMMMQEFPPHELVAFLLTGSKFYSSSALNELMTEARKTGFTPYYVHFGATFADTKIVPCEKKEANLKIWQSAIPNALRTNAYFSLGADPAFGSNAWKDGSALHVDRVYGDCVEQAAEFHSTYCSPTQFAWIIAILAGWYENTRVNLELNGPGQVVYQELDQLQRIAASSVATDQRALANVMGNLKHYIYQKYNGGARNSNTRHTITTQNSKEIMMTKHRDSVTNGRAKIYSVECIKEMTEIVRNGGTIEAGGRKKDDRAIAAALSHLAWIDNMRVTLMRLGITKEKTMAANEKVAGVGHDVGAEHALQGYLAATEMRLKDRKRALLLQQGRRTR